MCVIYSPEMDSTLDKTERNYKRQKVDPPTPTRARLRHVNLNLRSGHIWVTKRKWQKGKKKKAHREAKLDRQIQPLRPLINSDRKVIHTEKQVCGPGGL